MPGHLRLELCVLLLTVTPALLGRPGSSSKARAAIPPASLADSGAFVPQDEDGFVWRVQVRFKTADVNDAGTDDDVRVDLNGANQTVVDYGRNDFERNDDFTYDLVLDGVTRLRDIQFLRVSIPQRTVVLRGRSIQVAVDGWCVRELELLVNGLRIFDRQFPPPCQWLDDAPSQALTLTISNPELRQHAAWQSYNTPFPPMRISRAELESRIEAMVGNAISSTRLYWGHLSGRAVEVSRGASARNAVRVDLDLAAEAPGSDPSVDIDFDLFFNCLCRNMSIAGHNFRVSVNLSWYQDVLLWIAGVDLEGRLGRSVPRINYATNTGAPFCPTVTVEDEGDVVFGIPAFLPDLAQTGALEIQPQVAAPGEVVTLSEFTFLNWGAANSGAFSIGYYLSRFPFRVNPNDVRLGGTTSGPLGCQPARFPRQTITIPSVTPLGRYSLNVFVDDAAQITESDEANNVRGSDLIVDIPEVSIMTPFRLDFPWEVTDGYLVTAGFVRTSAGTARLQSFASSIDVSFGFYLSTDAVITTDDLRIGGGSARAVSLFNWTSETLVLPNALPTNLETIADGMVTYRAYYLGVLVDDTNALREANENNNASVVRILVP